MNNSLKIPVIEKKRPLAGKIFSYSFLIITTTLLLSFIFINDPNNILGKFFLLIMGIFLIWMFLIKNPYTISGYLILEKEEIYFVDSTNNKQSFSIQDIKSISLEYTGYQGRSDILSGSFDSGLGNKLRFNSHEKKLCFELLIKSQHLKNIKKVFSEWEQKNKKVIVKNFLGIKILL